MADLLTVEDLTVDYLGDAGDARVVDKVSFAVAPGEILGLAGESGSGKSTIAHALLRLVPPPGVISGGRVLWKGRDLLAMTERELRRVRWREIALVMQAAMNALSPVLPIGEQLTDVFAAHGRSHRRDARAAAAALLERVGIDAARLDGYAHQLSGGMRQRVCIAMALALEPALVIMDEPTTALDVVVERDILRDIRALAAERGFAVLLVSHDLPRMAEVCGRIARLERGRLVDIRRPQELS